MPRIRALYSVPGGEMAGGRRVGSRWKGRRRKVRQEHRRKQWQEGFSIRHVNGLNQKKGGGGSEQKCFLMEVFCKRVKSHKIQDDKMFQTRLKQFTGKHFCLSSFTCDKQFLNGIYIFAPLGGIWELSYHFT